MCAFVVGWLVGKCTYAKFFGNQVPRTSSKTHIVVKIPNIFSLVILNDATNFQTI